MPSATTTVELDDRGRVTIPAPVRQKLSLSEGDPVEIEVRADE